MQVNAANKVQTLNGTNGQLYTARGAGITPNLRTLLSGDGSVNIAVNATDIDIRVAGGGARQVGFTATFSAGIPLLQQGINQPIGAYSGTPGSGLPPLVIPANCDPYGCITFLGSPGHPAIFTAPRNGLYNFTLDIRSNILNLSGSPASLRSTMYFLPTAYVGYQKDVIAFVYINGTVYNLYSSQAIYLNAGDTLTWQISLTGTHTASVGFQQESFITGYLIS